jgi:hypothetical protein
MQDKWDYINQLDDELLRGGVIISEWTAFLVRDADTAYCSNANLATILASQAAIESHLRFDYFSSENTSGWTFYKLIENSDLSTSLKEELNTLRKLRNKWVHIHDPQNDNDLITRPEYHENELQIFAKTALKIMRQVLYNNPFV